MEIIQEVALAIIGFAGGVSVAAGTFALILSLIHISEPTRH